jgi:hypothetical protein
MNLIQKIRSWFFGKEESIETPTVVETPVVEAPVVIETPVVEKLTKEEVKEVIKAQEAKPKPKRKYNKKKKSTGESK